MNIISIKSVIAAFVLVLTSVAGYSQVSKVDIMATGLTCSMCSNAINKQLKSLSQIADVTTDLNTNTFTVTFKENEMASPNVIKDAVEKAGFFVGSMVLTVEPEKLVVTDKKANIGGESFVIMDSKNGNSGQFRVLDKGFVTQKEYKKLAKTYAKHSSYLADNGSLYHVVAQ